MADFSFIKQGITKEQFIESYTEQFNATSETNTQNKPTLAKKSIFNVEHSEKVANDLFDMLNLTKGKDGEDEILDADEINALANLDKTDGENTLTEADINVLLNNYEKTLSTETPIDTPEKMYENAMSQQPELGSAIDNYLQTLNYQISTTETLISNRQLNSNQIITDYNNQINDLIQKDNNISNELKSTYKKENDKLKDLTNNEQKLTLEIQRKQKEIEEADAESKNLRDNIEYAEQNGKDSSEYSDQLASLSNRANGLSKEISNLQNQSKSVRKQINTTKKTLKDLQNKASTQNKELQSKIYIINNKIESEKELCRKDIEQYTKNAEAYKNAQEYALQRVQSETTNDTSIGNGDDTYVFDESNYDESAVSALEQRWSKIAKKNGLDTKFFAKVTAIAKDLKCDPNALLAVMNSESGISPKARNPHGGATGLIQFMPSTAKALGTTTSALANMSAYDQLDYVAKCFKMSKRVAKMGDGPMSAADLYSLVFLPARANRDVLTTKGEAYYNANAGLDNDKDGKITKADLNRRIQKCMA